MVLTNKPKIEIYGTLLVQELAEKYMLLLLLMQWPRRKNVCD